MTKKHFVPISRAAALPEGLTVLDFMALVLSMITMLGPVFSYKNGDTP